MSRRTQYEALLDAVNEAKTEAEHDRAKAVLSGYRQALSDYWYGWSGVLDDIYTMERYGDRPMCCGAAEAQPEGDGHG